MRASPGVLTCWTGIPSSAAKSRIASDQDDCRLIRCAEVAPDGSAFPGKWLPVSCGPTKPIAGFSFVQVSVNPDTALVGQK